MFIMQRLLRASVLVIGLFVVAIAAAELPFTDEVFEANLACEAVLKTGDLDAVGKAFLAVLVASDPMDEEERVAFADATEAELQKQLNSVLEIAWEDDAGRAPYLLAFWKAVAAAYPEDNVIQSRYMWAAVSSPSTPWAEVQRLLIANGERGGLRLG